MSEFMSRSPQVAQCPAGGGYGQQQPVHVASPAEMARDSVVELERDNHEIQRRITALHAAHDANDPEKWSEARGRVEAGIREAVQAQDRSRARNADMDAAIRGRADAAAHVLSTLEATAATLTKAPEGFAHFHGEHAIQAALAAPLQGGAAAGNQRKEQTLRELFGELSPGDSRTLAERLRRARENDPLVKAFMRMTADRRQRLLRYLDEAPKRAALERENELRAGKSPAHDSHVEIDVLEHRHFEVTEIGSISEPIRVTYLVHSDDPVTIDSFSVDTTDAERAGEIDVITRASGTVVNNGEPLAVEVAFRPKKHEALHSYLMLHGHTASKPVKKGALLTAPTPAKTVEHHKDANELALAERASRDVEAGYVSASTATYSEMLASVLAAQRLTDHDQREQARKVLDAVDQRLEQLDGVAHEKLAEYGFAHTAGYAIFDGARGAIRLWIAKIKLGSSIATGPLLTEFRVGAEAIRLCTGEIKESKDLRALDKASYYTLAAMGGVMAAPAVATLVVEEAALLGFAARAGVRSLTVWALHNPAAALAVSEVLVGFGIQIGEDGWDAFVSQLEDPRGRLFIVMQVLMDVMHVHAAGSTPQASRGSDMSVEPSVPPEALAETRVRLAKARAVLQDTAVRAQGAGETGADELPRKYQPTVSSDPTLVAGQGATDKYGNVRVSPHGTATDRALVLEHENVHSVLSPKAMNGLREFRANARMTAYQKSGLIRYLEEALAETVAQVKVNGPRPSSFLEGMTFPITNGYVSLSRVVTEAAIGTIAYGGIVYGVYVTVHDEHGGHRQTESVDGGAR